MSRLPTPGQDNNVWGQILNDFLDVAHNDDGSLRGDAVKDAGAVMSVNSATPNSTGNVTITSASINAIPVSEVGAANGVAALNSSGHVPTTQLGSDSSSSSNFLRGDGTWATTNGGSSALANDTDVAINSPSNGQLLTYSSGSSKWQNQNAPSGLVVNVKDYGATGNGSTDDTTAIATAIAAVRPSQITASGTTGTVFFPSGTYITSPLPALSEQVSLVGVGPGTIIQLKANSSTSANLISNYQGTGAGSQMITVRDMIPDGNKFNQGTGAYQSGIVMINPTPSGSHTYVDSRHMFHGLTIQNFTGDGMVLVGRGVAMVSDVSSWVNNGFGFNINEDSYFSNCDAGSSGLDGFLIQGGSNRLSNCKAWFSGSALVTSRTTNSGTQPTVNAPTANYWCGGNYTVPLVFSLANGFGNGFHWTTITGTSKAFNFAGGSYGSCGAQDNARAGFYLDDCGRQTLIGVEADSNNNNGTSDGTKNGTPLGSYAGIEIANFSSNNIVSGISWNRFANANQQAAALRIDSSNKNRVELAFFGNLNGGVNNMPALTSDSVMVGNYVKFASEGGFNNVTSTSSFTPDPFKAATTAMTLTSNTTFNNPAANGTNGGTGIYYPPGMALTFILTQDGTGSRTVSWGNNYTLPATWSVAPQANAVTVIKFTYNGNAWIADGSQNGIIGASAFAPTGLPGATASSRYIGATVSGAPTSGSFTTGDHSIDQSGAMWICTSAGTPGTWVQSGIIASRTPVFAAQTAASQSGQYQQIATVTITSQFFDATIKHLVVSRAGGAQNAAGALVTWRVKQQATLGNPPFVSVYVDNAEQFSFSNFIAVIESNTVSSSVVTLWVQAPTNFENYFFYELAVTPTSNTANVTIAYMPNSAVWGSIDAGTQAVGVAGPSYGLPMSLTGATAATRYVGGTASGAPASGTFAIGDFVVDQTGKFWICTSAGSPGTWSQPSGTGATLAANTFSGNQTAPAFAASGLSGTTSTSRYVGATASGAPTSGTFVTGDYAVDQTGTIWVCTAGGTPGTWANVSSGSPLPNYATITTARPGVPSSGQYLTTANGGSTGTLTTTSASLGIAYLVPIDVAKSGGQTFTGLSTNVTISAVGGTTVQVLMALYPDNGIGSGPSTSSSQISGSAISFVPTSTGAVDTSFGSPLALSVGRYWAAWCLTAAANPATFPTIVSLSPLGNSVLDQLGNVSHKGVYVSISGSASTLPTTLSGLTIGFGSFPIMGLKAQ